MEAIEVTLECLDGVVISDVVLLELLDNHQDEQVQHHMRNYHNKTNVV